MEQVLQQFRLDGTPISCEPLGNGHINRTFRVVCDNRKASTLQRINRGLPVYRPQADRSGVHPPLQGQGRQKILHR